MDPFDGTGKNFLVKAEHWARYAFAVNYLVKRKVSVVYDVTCGTGYGTVELANEISQVFGFDRNVDFLEIARQRYAQIGDKFYRIDLDQESLVNFVDQKSLPRPQVVVCLETLEHLQKPERILSEFGALIESGGWLICSVPNAKFESTLESGQPANPFHLHLFTPKKMEALLSQAGFEVMGIYGQPWTNLLIRNTKRPVRKWFDRFLVNERKFKSMASKVAWPTRILVGQSDSFLMICRKRFDKQK